MERNHVASSRWATVGIAGGLIAGIVMGMTAMLWMWLAGQGFWWPMNLIASIVLGQDTVSPAFEVGPSLLGMGIHLILSALFGLVFAYAMDHTIWPEGMFLVVGVVYGFLLWLLNVVTIDMGLIPAGLDLAPIVPVVVAHLVYGAVLGLATAPALARGGD